MAAASDRSSTSEAQEIRKLVTSAERQGTPDRYPGKRRRTRFTAGMRLEITTDAAIPSSSSHVIMQNVSEGGFAFWSKRELPEHTPLFVREFSRDGDGEWMAAHVRHCTVGIRGYLVGAEFAYSLPEDEADAQPRR
ncbi:MAG: PilZ domain-containing protein [Planctomycetota bacterium]